MNRSAKKLTDCKHIEEILRQNESKFRTLAEGIEEVFWLTRPDEPEQVIYVSPAYEKIWGRTCEELYTNPRLWVEAIHPEDQESVHRRFEAFLNGNTDFNVEYRIIQPDGSIRWVWDRGFEVIDHTTGIRQIAGIAQDITERKRFVEELLQAREAAVTANVLLEKTFASLDEAIFVIDPTTRTIIACNPAVEQIFGYRREEVIGCNTEFLHVNRTMYERFGKELFLALNASGVFHYEFQMRRKDGSLFFSEHTVTEIVDDTGHRTGVVSVVRDITTRKQAEEELQTYREHLEELVKERTSELRKEIAERKRVEEEINSVARFPADNPYPVLRITKDGMILYANRSSSDLLKAWNCQINQRLSDYWRDFTARVFHSRSNTLAEITCEQRVLSLTFAPIVDAGYVNVYGLDITERKRAEEELQQAKKALEIANQELEERVQQELKKRQEQQHLLIQRSKLEALGKLAAGIAHEINQPLAGISMGLDNMLLKLSSEKITGEYLHQKINVLLQHIERIKHIIDHIRTFSRDQTSTLIERVDVNKVCRDAVLLVQTQYSNHNVEILMNLDETIDFVLGNSYKLEQVVLNLLANAKDAVDEKEKRGVESSYHKQIAMVTSCDRTHIYLAIEDNGIGISDEHKQNIFDPFFTTKDAEHGTGLGLSLSYGIIKEMQGDISVQSKVGVSTMMRISLPRVTLNTDA
jgi:PAS domain S-box-containing protein